MPLHFFLICYALLMAALVPVRAARAIRASARRLQAARQNEMRVAAVGIAPFRIRLAAFVISGMITGARRRALCRSQPLRQPVDAVLAHVGRTDRADHPRRHRRGCSARSPARCSSCCSNIVLGGMTERWQFFLGLILLGVVLFARGGLIGLLAGKARHG